MLRHLHPIPTEELLAEFERAENVASVELLQEHFQRLVSQAADGCTILESCLVSKEALEAMLADHAEHAVVTVEVHLYRDLILQAMAAD